MMYSVQTSSVTFLASKVGPGGRVIAVEPSERELNRLRTNLSANSLHNVTIVAAALAERPGVLRLNVAEVRHAGQNTLGTFIYANVTSSEVTSIPAVTLDELQLHAVQNVDLIKLDIEGAELRTLMGAKGLLQSAKPLLLLEISPAALASQGGSIDELSTLLERSGYHIFCFDRSTGLPVPAAEAPLSSNVVAVHRERDWGLLDTQA